MNTDLRMTILFVTPIIPEYRKWLYVSLSGIPGWSLVALHGGGPKGSYPVDIGKSESFADVIVKNSYLRIKGIPLCWQHCTFHILKAKPSAVILLDNVKVLSNWWVWLISRFIGFKLIFFTHGWNRGEYSNQRGMIARGTEILRRFFLSHSDAVIAYTAKVGAHLKRDGVVKQDRIFSSSNTLDLEEISKIRDSLMPETLQAIRQILAIGDKFTIGFLGRLTPKKNLSMFIDTLVLLAAKYDIAGLIIGEGPEIKRVREVLVDKGIDYIHVVGEQTGEQLAAYLGLAKIIFLPDHAGLAIGHSFAFGLPFVTGASSIHGPEIEYLQDGYNGFIVQSPDKYRFAGVIERLILDHVLLRTLSQHADETAKNSCNPVKAVNAFKLAVQRSLA